jgi:hypothetical protein
MWELGKPIWGIPFGLVDVHGGDRGKLEISWLMMVFEKHLRLA